MADTAQPLNQRVPIVNADGTPTDYFIRMMRDFSENTISGSEADAWEVQGGIGIDGGGPVSAGVTLDANVQEILDELGVDQGSVLFRGASGWEALGPGTSGQFLKTNGAAADPEWAAGGGGGTTLTPPTDSMFSITLNAPTVTDLTTMMRMECAGGLIIRGKLMSLPGGNFSVRVKLASRSNGNFNANAILFRDTAGKYISVGRVYNNGYAIGIDQWNNSTSYNSGIAYNNPFGHADDVPSWFRADFNATTNDVSGYFSIDGQSWVSMGIDSTFLSTCDAFGIGMPMNGSAGATYWLHWEVV